MTLPPGTYLGTRRRSRALGGFRLIETRYRPGTVLEKHDHALGHFCLVIEGAFAESVEGSTRQLGPGRLHYQPAGQAHAEVHTLAGRHFLIEVDSPHATPTREDGDRLDRPMDLSDSPARAIAARIYQAFGHSDSASDLDAEALAAELVGWACWARHARPDSAGASPAIPAWLGRIRRLLHDRFAEKLSLTELAAEAGVHRVHLAQRFRRAYGVPPGEYQRRLRLEFAFGELRSGARSISDVALAAGFADQSHLTRAFRRTFGAPPGRLRDEVD
jgi:AraC family transcriptional regulator